MFVYSFRGSCGPSFVRRLDEVGLADAAVVGGKAAALGELTRAGIPVPPGFVVPAETFGQAMAAVDPAGSLVRAVAGVAAGDVPAITAAASRLRERITALPLPGDVVAQITAAYQSLASPGDAAATDAGGGAVQRHHGGQPDGELRRTAGHLSGRARPGRGARRGAPVLGQLYNDESVAYRRRLAAARGRPGHGGRDPAHDPPARGRRDVHPQPDHRRPFGGGHRGHLGAGLRAGVRGGEPGRLHGQQGDRRDHRAAGRRQAEAAFLRAERTGDLLLAPCPPACGGGPA